MIEPYKAMRILCQRTDERLGALVPWGRAKVGQQMGMRNRMLRDWTTRAIVAAWAALLVVTMVSPVLAAGEDVAPWEGEIDEMLDAGEHAKGQVVAAFRMSEERADALPDAPYTIDPLMETGASSAEAALDGKASDLRATERVTFCLVSSDSLSTEELLLALADDARVVYAEPNYVGQLDSDGITVESDTQALTTAELSAQAADAAPIDDITNLQWNFWSGSQVSRTGGTAANPSINVPAFGSSQKGANMAKEVVVALLDTPVDHTNPDLASVIYHFSDEQQQKLGCWEWGYNAVGGGVNSNVFDEDAHDLGHGTHVAGIIGAAWDGHGLSGVASNVRIVSVQLPDADGVESMADALHAYDFINRFNAQAPEAERIKVVNNSWSQYLSTRALDAAVREVGDTWGVVSVFSAGNDGKNNDTYEKTPSSFADNPYAIVVASSTAADELADSSEYGEATVDLAAPGAMILSTMPLFSSRYYADASRSTNLAYTGFDDGGDTPITLTQLDATALDSRDHLPVGDPAEVATSASAVSGVHFFGERSLKVDLERSYSSLVEGDDENRDFYLVRLTFDLSKNAVVSQLKDEGQLMLGMALTTDGSGEADASYVSTNATKGYFYEATISSASSATWGTSSIKITSEGFDPSARFADNEILGTAAQATEGTAGLDAAAQEGEGDEGLTVVTQEEKGDEGLTVVTPTDKSDEGPSLTAQADEDDDFTVTMVVSLPEGVTSLYIDSIGLGTQVVPYMYQSGTSMAAPAVTGAAAVLASEGHEGASLASLVRSKIRIPASGAMPLKTGGVFDFNASGSPDDGGSQALAPDVTGLSLDSSTVTITGSNFGLSQGTVDLSRYIVAKEPATVAARVTSWSDTQIVVELDGSFQGIMRAVVTNAAGKYDTYYQMLSKGEGLFERDLPLETLTGDPAIFDAMGDWETEGPLVGCGCKLYYLPAAAPNHDADDLAYQRLRCFDLKTSTWSELPSLPEWLQGASAVMYNGKIVVEGATMYMEAPGRPTANFPADTEAEERVYVYDPVTQKWSPASSEGMYFGQTIVNDAGQLKLVGGGLPTDPETYETLPAPVMEYELSTGAGKVLCDLPVDTYDYLHYLAYPLGKDPQAVVKDGAICLYSDYLVCEGYPVAVLIEGDTVKMVDLPEMYFAAQDEPFNGGAWSSVRLVHFNAALAATVDGFVLVGPPAADGSTDTYLLRKGSTAFEPYQKRASDDRVYGPAACAYRGQLYVIGSSWFEPQQRFFRATAMNTFEYPGDIPCEKTDPETKPDPTIEPEVTPEQETKPGKEAKPASQSNPKSSKTSGSTTAQQTTQATTKTNGTTSASQDSKPLAKTGDDARPDVVVMMAGMGLALALIGSAVRRSRVS